MSGMDYKNQKTAIILGLFGLLPFIAPIIFIPLVDGILIQTFLLVQIIYGSIIMCFMGGVQWGYAVAMGKVAPPFVYVASVIPALLIILFLVFNQLFGMYGFIIHFVVGIVILAQAIMDHFIMAEGWFVKLRWILAILASSSLMIGGYMMA